MIGVLFYNHSQMSCLLFDKIELFVTMKNKYKCICSKCGSEYVVECTQFAFEHGKYRKTCSSKCANSRNMTDERRNRISIGVKKHNETKPQKLYSYICEKCGIEFTTKKPFRKNRKVKCGNCIQKRKHVQDNPDSIMELSKRTISKILHRSGVGCAICGWNESTCDIHHIIERKSGGTNDVTNLIIVCPNCHRIIHSNKKYSIETLQQLSIDKHFKNWRDFYHPSN